MNAVLLGLILLLSAFSTILLGIFVISQLLNATIINIVTQEALATTANYLFIAELTGDNVVPDTVKTNATGVAKFTFDPSNNNQIYYQLNITNMKNDILNVDIHQGKKRENGPSLATLYRSSLGIPLSQICCKSAEAERSKSFYFNGTISKEDFEFGPLADSRDISGLINLFDTGNAYVEVYTNRPDSLSLSDAEVRGEILPSSS
jgi:hypothetical protein